MPDVPNNVLMEGVTIIFRNFKGEEGPFNKEGTRNFGVLIDDKTAEDMAADGWNVKTLQPREEDEDDVEQPWLPVDIRFDVFPPNVYLITERGRTRLVEDQIGMLDWAEITNVDLIVRPYPWKFNGKTGIKAYVKTMVVSIEEDELERKYADVDEAGE